MIKLNYDDAVAITREIHWVGFYDEQARLHCNPYLLMDEEDIILFDPGSIPHFPIVMRKVIDLVNPGDITAVVAAHQDPDVCGNLPVLEDVINRPDLDIVAHTNTIRLIRHYGVQSNFYAVDKNDFKLTLKSGRVLEFLFTPYLHSPGAIVTYDRKTRSLFTSDIFGAINEDWSLFASGDYLHAMKAWHQNYMPSNRILKACMKRLQQLEIDRILPQHGSVLEGDQVQAAIDYLMALPCGVDLVEE
jgi:flavorubredoxin